MWSVKVARGIAFGVFSLAFGCVSSGAAPPPLVVQSVSAGGYHVCAVVNGGAQCWGENDDGEIGNNDIRDVSAPTPVIGLSSGVTAVASGEYHSCALVSGGVKCWGYNSDGELGNGSTAESDVPVAVQGLSSGVIAISAGNYHTCALLGTGSIKCWGWNPNGGLGDGTTNATNAGAPTTVASITNATAISAGGYHSCALVNGGVKCWGYNADGELADGNIADSHVPVDVWTLTSGVAAIDAGQFHTCALLNSGAVRCWGWNNDGMLGDNTQNATNSGSPATPVGLTSGVTAIGAGGNHSCAIVGGAMSCWGDNVYGALGNGTRTTAFKPVASAITSGALSVSAGMLYTCAIVQGANGDNVKCVGDNFEGQIGQADAIFQPAPVSVSGPGTVAAIGQGSATLRTCVIISGGTAKCWGDNEGGELGNGSVLPSSVPVAVSGLTSVTKIAMGAYHTCAVNGGKAECWGSNGSGQIGDGTTAMRLIPVVAIAAGVTDITAGYTHTCAIVGGAVKCWGDNSFGELGTSGGGSSSTPVAVPGVTGTAVSISAGIDHTCAVMSTGKIMCWGYNSNGQVGNGTVGAPASAAFVSNIASGATAVSAGGYHTCAIVSGGMQCWGDGQIGQLGNGAVDDSHVPVAVIGFTTGVTAIATGLVSSCAIHGGGAYCFGSSFYGQLGNGAFDYATAPAPVSGMTSGASLISSGQHHGCAASNGTMKCWGTDYTGELGDARFIYLTAPFVVNAGDAIFANGFEGN